MLFWRILLVGLFGMLVVFTGFRVTAGPQSPAADLGPAVGRGLDGWEIFPLSEEVLEWADDRGSKQLYGAELDNEAERVIVLIDRWVDDPFAPFNRGESLLGYTRNPPLETMPCGQTACELISDDLLLAEETVIDGPDIPRSTPVYQCLSGGSDEACELPSLWALLGGCTLQVTRFPFGANKYVRKVGEDFSITSEEFGVTSQTILVDWLLEFLETECDYTHAPPIGYSN